jgi:hypothetical protein
MSLSLVKGVGNGGLAGSRDGEVRPVGKGEQPAEVADLEPTQRSRVETRTTKSFSDSAFIEWNKLATSCLKLDSLVALPDD